MPDKPEYRAKEESQPDGPQPGSEPVADDAESSSAEDSGQQPPASEGLPITSDDVSDPDSKPNPEVQAAISDIGSTADEGSEPTPKQAAPKPVVSAPPSFDEEPPPETVGLFEALKNHCDQQGVKCTIETDAVPGIVIAELEFRNGRSVRRVAIASEESAQSLLSYPLGQFVFLGDYAAVCSYEASWIEAAVRAHGTIPRPVIARRLFGVRPDRSQPMEMALVGSSGLTIRLTEKHGVLAALEYTTPLYVRIEGIGITEHDKATNLLEDLSNALFMQIDFRFDSPLTLGKERFLLRRSSAYRARLDEDNQLIYPRYSYEKSPSSLYWYGRSASSMPLLQFLAFYQCLEFFFPRYARQETIHKVRNILKDPSFDSEKDFYLNSILNATLEGRRGALLEERKQLAATLKQCVDPTALHDFLNETDERRKYYTNDYKKVSDKKLVLTEEAAVVEQAAERIYDIRCKVVHTKNLDSGEGEEMILPFSKEADLMLDDVELIKFLTRRVLIASGSGLKI